MTLLHTVRALASNPRPRPIVPRLELDLGWRDLMAGLFALAGPGANTKVRAQLEAEWAPEGGGFACLTVRSGWDLLLAALALPAGSEVLVSAITIRDMARVIEAHDLRVVPIDVAHDTLAPNLERLEAQVTPRTRILLIAHLFGGRIDLAPYVAFAQKHDLFLIEDAAQAFTGTTDMGDPRAFATLSSFGPIKTATALGGAMLTVRDPRVLARMRAIEGSFPLQTRAAFLDRVLRYGALKLLSLRVVFGTLIWGMTVLGKSYDEALNQATRSIPASELFEQIRQRACGAQLQLLRRRLSTYDAKVVRERTRVGRALLAALDSEAVSVPGRESKAHSFWVFPINAREPTRLVAELLRAGFDATPTASSMLVLTASDGREARCPGATRALSRLVYLPVPPGLSMAEILRLAAVVNADARV